LPPSHPLITPAGSCVTSRCTTHSLLLLRRPLIVLSCQLVLAYPLVIFSLRRPLILSSCWLVVVLPLVPPPTRAFVAPPSHPLFTPADCCITSRRSLDVLPSCPLIAPSDCCVASPCFAHLVLSLCHPLASTEYQLNSCQLVVALPLVTPPSCLLLRRPLALLLHQLVVALPLVVLWLRCPSRHVAPAGCHIASPCPFVVPPSHCLVAPAGSCIASCRPLVALPSRPLIAPAGCCITSRCAAHLSSCCAALSS
jgi:hypothetical protein